MHLSTIFSTFPRLRVGHPRISRDFEDGFSLWTTSTFFFLAYLTLPWPVRNEAWTNPNQSDLEA